VTLRGHARRLPAKTTRREASFYSTAPTPKRFGSTKTCGEARRGPYRPRSVLVSAHCTPSSEGAQWANINLGYLSCHHHGNGVDRTMASPNQAALPPSCERPQSAYTPQSTTLPLALILAGMRLDDCTNCRCQSKEQPEYKHTGASASTISSMRSR
jgi:hypothetical protein